MERRLMRSFCRCLRTVIATACVVIHSGQLDAVAERSAWSLETFVQLSPSTGETLQVELRHSCCDSIPHTALAFCEEFKISARDCAMVERMLTTTGDNRCACPATIPTGFTSTLSSQKLGNFALSIVREGQSQQQQQTIKLAMYAGDFATIDERVDATCERVDLDTAACGRLRKVLYGKSLELEMKAAASDLRAASHDPLTTDRAMDSIDTMIKKLGTDRERLLKELDEKAQAYTDLYLQTKTDRHRLERRVRELEQRLDQQSRAQREQSTPLQIPRVHVSNFSYADYLKHAESSTPVIIQGLSQVVRSPGVPLWSLRYLNDTCGDATAILKHPVSRSGSDHAMWAGIKPVATTSLRRFLDDISLPEPRNWPTGYSDLYLHDASIPTFCPALLESFAVPRYFTDDRMQALPPRFKQRDYWPSLFIGDESTASALHSDWSFTAAWMGLIQGRKHWAIAKPTATAALYEDVSSSSAPAAGRFNASLLGQRKLVDLLRPGEVYDGILEAGEVIFIPADCPHQVRNLEKTVAVAVNFVDSVNLDGFKRSLGQQQDRSVGEEYRKLARDLQLLDRLGSTPVHPLQDLPFRDFKHRLEVESASSVIGEEHERRGRLGRSALSHSDGDEAEDEDLNEYYSVSRPLGPRDFDPYERGGSEPPPESTLPSEWQFLHKWFLQLRRARLSIENPSHPDTDAIRIGRDADDWWFSVHILPESPRWEARKFYVKHYRTTREALLLTVILAQVNYDAWKKELDTVSKFRVPDRFGMPIRPLERKFAFLFTCEMTVNEYDWVKLKDLFGGNALSKEFKVDMAQAMHVAKSNGLEVATMEPIPVKISFHPSRGRYRTHAKGICNIINTVNAMNDIVASRGFQSGKNILPLVFKLDAIDLRLDQAQFHAEVFDAMRYLLCTGVTIRSLSLPTFAETDFLTEDCELIEAWSLLMRAVCGVKAGAPTRVRQLSIHSDFRAAFMYPCYLACAFSALACARGLESLDLDALSYGHQVEKNERVWSWLVFALRSCSSIKKVGITSIKLDALSIDRIEAIAQDPDPLGRLWEHMTGTALSVRRGCPTSRSSVVINKDSQVAFLGLGQSEEACMILREAYAGVVVHDEPKLTTIDVFLPGVGLCRIKRSSVSNKRSRRDDSSQPSDVRNIVNESVQSLQVESLKLGVKCETPHEERDGVPPSVAEVRRANILRLFKVFDRSRLTALWLEAIVLDDGCLAACLELFPNLQSLRVGGGELQSFEWLSHAYNARDCRVSSFRFERIAVSTDAFESFLQLFLMNHPIKHKLKKIRVVDGDMIRLHQSTADLIALVLEDTSTFDCFHVCRRFSYMRTSSVIKWRTRQFHKQPLHTPLPPAAKLAFLSIARHFSEASDHGAITREIAASIFEFAAPFTHERTVNVEDEVDDPWWM